MTKEVQCLFLEKNTMFRCGDGAFYSAARVSLKRGIREAKATYKRITEHPSTPATVSSSLLMIPLQWSLSLGRMYLSGGTR